MAEKKENKEIKREEVEVRIKPELTKEQIKKALDALYVQKQTYIYALNTAIKEENAEVIECSANGLALVIKNMNYYKIKLNTCEAETK
jgi:ribosomal protein L23